MKNIVAIILLMMCWGNSQALSKKQLKDLNMNVSGYELMPFEGDYAVVKNSVGHYGLIDQTGQLVYPAEYDTIISSSEYFNLLKDGKSILLNSAAEFLGDSTQYSSITLCGNLARLIDHEGKHGFYGPSSLMVLPVKYHESDYVVYTLSDGEYMFALRNETGMWALSYPKTNWISEYVYSEAPKFISDHYLLVTIGSATSVFDGKELKEIVPFRENVRSYKFWNNAVSFYVGMNKKDSLDYIYTSDGKSVMKYPEEEFCYWKNKYIVVSKGGEERNIPLKIVNRGGKSVLILKTVDNLCWQYKKDKWVFRTTEAKKLAGPYDEFDFLDQDDQELAHIVGDAGKYGAVNLKGKEIVPLKYKSVRFHPSGNVKVFDDVQFGDSVVSGFSFYSISGKRLKGGPFIYDPYVDSTTAHFGTPLTENGVMWLMNDEGKFGLCKVKDMKVLIPFVCDKCGTPEKNGMAVAYYGGRQYYINNKGEGLPDAAYKK